MTQHPRGALALGLALSVTSSSAFVFPPPLASRVSAVGRHLDTPVAAASPKKTKEGVVVQRRGQAVAPLQGWLESVGELFTGEDGLDWTRRELLLHSWETHHVRT